MKRPRPAPPKRNKAVDRGKTKELLDCLDCLVPVRERPLAEEKGKLESRRTVLQLYEDCIVHIKSIMNKEEACDAPATRSSGSVFHGDVLRNGMSSSFTFPFITLRVPSLVVESASQMVQYWYRNSPFRTLRGQNILHFIDYSDRWKWRAYLKRLETFRVQGGQISSTMVPFEANLICFTPFAFPAVNQTECKGVGVETMKCLWVPTCVNSDGCVVFLLYIQPPSFNQQTRKRKRVESQEFCEIVMEKPQMSCNGVYGYDELCSTCFPWNVDSAMHAVEKDSHPPFVQAAIVGMWSARHTMGQMFNKIVGSFVPSVTGGLTRYLSRLVQIHFTCLPNVAGVATFSSHLRIEFPSILGSIHTPWKKVVCVPLDGRLVPIGDNKFTCYCPYMRGEAGNVQWWEAYFRKEENRLVCYHTRVVFCGEDEVHGRIIKVVGEVLKGDSSECTLDFQHVLKWVSGTDPKLQVDRELWSSQAVQPDIATLEEELDIFRAHELSEFELKCLPAFYADRLGKMPYYPHSPRFPE